MWLFAGVLLPAESGWPTASLVSPTWRPHERVAGGEAPYGRAITASLHCIGHGATRQVTAPLNRRSIGVVPG